MFVNENYEQKREGGYEFGLQNSHHSRCTYCIYVHTYVNVFGFGLRLLAVVMLFVSSSSFLILVIYDNNNKRAII